MILSNHQGLSLARLLFRHCSKLVKGDQPDRRCPRSFGEEHAHCLSHGFEPWPFINWWKHGDSHPDLNNAIVLSYCWTMPPGVCTT